MAFVADSAACQGQPFHFSPSLFPLKNLKCTRLNGGVLPDPHPVPRAVSRGHKDKESSTSYTALQGFLLAL